MDGRETKSVEENEDNCEDLIEEECVEEAREENALIKCIMDQIFQSPLPPYSPVISPDDFFSSEKYFTCAECSDKFVVESSLKFHMERRSVLISFDCADCGTTVTVFNRCSLLAHFRLHSVDGNYVIDPARIKMIPIPFDKMLLGPLMIGNKCDSDDPNAISNKSLNESASDSLASIRCFECNEKIMQSLREHFVGNNIPINCDLQCNHCNLILPTKCSMKAHLRYHKRKQPYVCPECTELFIDWDSFIQHMSSNCYHTEKCVRYKCPCCELVVKSYISLQAHFCEKHVKIVFKCNGCPVACFTKQALQAHINNFHAKGPLSPMKSYRQCQLCPEILLQESLLLAHVLEHVKKPAQRVYGYQCNLCNSAFQERENFREHKDKCNKNHRTVQTVVENESSSVNSSVSELPPQTKSNTPSTSSWMSLSDIQNSKTKNGTPCKTITSILRIPVAQLNKNLNLKTLSASSNTVSSQKLTSTNKPLTVISKSSLPMFRRVILPAPGGNITNSDGVKTFLVEKGKHQVNGNKLTPLSTFQISMGNKKALNGQSASQQVKNVLNGMDKPVITVNQKKVTRIISQCIMCRKELVFNIPSGDKSNMNVSLRCLTCTRKFVENKKKGQDKVEIVNNGISEDTQQNSSVVGSQKLDNSRPNNVTISEPLRKKLKISHRSKTELKEKFSCHVCQSILPLDWDLIKNHYSTKHKDLNIIVVAPKAKNSETDSEESSVTDFQPRKLISKKSKIITQEVTFPKGNKVNTDSESLTNHVQLSNKMPIDTQQQTSSSKLKKVIPSEESSNVKKLSNTHQQDGSPKESKSEMNSGSSKSKSRKKIQRREKKTTFSPLISGQVISSVNQKNTDGKYNCSVCKSVCENVTVFRSHIVTHNSDRSAYQCMECGMCFVVRPSFEKHLIIYHCIKNVDTYIQENELCQLKSPEKTVPQDTDESKENECCVCHQQFENAVELRKHFRTHGMAFLSMNKRELKCI